MPMRNKKNHEPNSPAAMLFLLIIGKVHHINELILFKKSFQNLQLLLFSLNAAFCSECWQQSGIYSHPDGRVSWCFSEQNLSKAFFAASSQSRTVIQYFQGECCIWECKKIQMAKGNLNAGLCRGRNEARRKLGLRKRKERQNQPGRRSVVNFSRCK